VLYNALYALHRQTVVTAAFGVTLVFNVALNLLLIPRYSYMASSVLTVASEILNGIVVLVASWRTIGPLRLGPTIAKLSVVTLATALVLWSLRRYGIFVGLPIGVLLVLLGLRVTHLIGVTEREILQSMPLVGRYAGLL
jgi:O-antigen/teichoic acid export membrane protein